jgi:hypothetical protein
MSMMGRLPRIQLQKLSPWWNFVLCPHQEHALGFSWKSGCVLKLSSCSTLWVAENQILHIMWARFFFEMSCHVIYTCHHGWWIQYVSNTNNTYGTIKAYYLENDIWSNNPA